MRGLSAAPQVSYDEYKQVIDELRAIRPRDFLLIDRLADASLGQRPVEETRKLYQEAARLASDTQRDEHAVDKHDPMGRFVEGKMKKYRAFEQLYREYVVQRSAL